MRTKPNQNPGSSVLDELQLSNGLLGKAGEETITIIHPACDKGMNKFLQRLVHPISVFLPTLRSFPLFEWEPAAKWAASAGSLPARSGLHPWRALDEDGALVSFPVAQVPLLLRQSDLTLSLGTWKPTLRFFPLSESLHCCGYLSPRRLMLSTYELTAELGLRLNAEKSVLSPLQRTTYLAMVWGRPRCRHVFLLLRLSHLRGSRESEMVSQDQEILREGKPALHDQGHAAMPTCLGHVEETLVPVSGSGAGNFLSPCNTSNGCVPHRLGRGLEWPPRLRSVEWSPSSVAHQLPGDAGRVSVHSGDQPANPAHRTELAAQTTPEASLERLVPLVDYLAAWKLLPNVSVTWTLESGFYSRDFIVPTKDGEVAFRSEERIPPHIHPSTQEVPEVRFGGEAYQCWFLPSGLALSTRTFINVGVETECQEKCAFSITENHLSGCGVGFDDDAGTSVTCSDRVDPHCSRESERRPVTHCKAVSTTAGSDGSCVQRDTFWPPLHETPTVVAQDQAVLPEGKPVSHIKAVR
ncbi:Adenylosuccinate synthetase [Labeo rohita]|uniref:Adenylosuccinate synthetase n=1 Tax=Labeo rohita TaxID=84645 RepID=A0ABQ8LIR5_LABRO|nr:Adenylosuccinate synthetase [Labeo rohita]